MLGLGFRDLRDGFLRFLVKGGDLFELGEEFRSFGLRSCKLKNYHTKSDTTLLFRYSPNYSKKTYCCMHMYGYRYIYIHTSTSVEQALCRLGPPKSSPPRRSDPGSGRWPVVLRDILEFCSMT